MKKTVPLTGFLLFAILLSFFIALSTNVAAASTLCERYSSFSRIFPSCNPTPPPPPSADACPNVPGDQASGPCADDLCRDQGGTWNGSACELPPPPPPSDTGGRVRDVCDRYEASGRFLPSECVPTVRITYPNGGETFTVDDVVQIEWDSNRVDRCSVGHSISPDTLDWIATDLPGSQKSYTWTAKTWGSSFQDQQQKIYIICNRGSTQVSDYSDDFFAVEQPDICPNVPGRQPAGACADQVCADDGGTWNGATCVMPPPPENTLALCTDGIDNDEDSDVDLEDSDCESFKPKIVVNKIVINDSGGTAAPSDFLLYVRSESSGQINVVSGATNILPHTGLWIVGEFTRAGYEPKGFGGDCLNGAPIIAAGEVKTCTITNDDIPSGSGGGGAGGGGGAPSSGGSAGGGAGGGGGGGGSTTP